MSTTTSKRPAAAVFNKAAATTSSKRAKFDARKPHTLAADTPTADEHDVFLEVDEGAIGKRRLHRNAVNLGGYASDSSDEGFDKTQKKWQKEDGDSKKGKGKGKPEADDDDEDDDMFGGADSEEGLEDADEDLGKSDMQQKKVDFLDLTDIEGQVMTSSRTFADVIDEDAGRGSAASSSPEAELDPEIGAGGSKKHAPKMDAFNMKNEMDEGRFDTSGNFIRRAADTDAVHDRWLEGVSRKDMKTAREARERREQERRLKMEADDAVEQRDVLARLIVCLERGETPLEALARLGSGEKKKQKAKKSWRDKKRAGAGGEGAMDLDPKPHPKPAEDPKETRRKQAVEDLTFAADILLTRGQPEIYEETREGLMRQWTRETGENWVDKPTAIEQAVDADDAPAAAAAASNGGVDTGKEWVYRWTDGRDEMAENGPYDSASMKVWNDAGFFAEGVEFKEVGGVGGEWSRLPEF